MSRTVSDQEPLDPAAARIVSRVRWLMAISGATTVIALVVVLGVIGYRLFNVEGSALPPASVASTNLPKGARIVSTAVAGDRIAVTIDVNGALEIRTYDVRTLKPAGQLKFVVEP